MKKQELIHLHGLLAEVCNHCETQGAGAMDLDNYESYGVRPTSIHKSKTEHKAAVFALAGGITSHIDSTSETERVPASAD